ncbi:hypothetical protein PoMZ_05738, partial [Pyricularia oryzae]
KIARLQRKSSEKFNRLLRLRKQKRFFQFRNEIKIIRLNIKLSVKNIVEKNRLKVDELFFNGPFKSNLVPELRFSDYINVVNWFSVFDINPLNWIFANLIFKNNRWCFFKSPLFFWLICSQFQFLVILAE